MSRSGGEICGGCWTENAVACQRFSEAKRYNPFASQVRFYREADLHRRLTSRSTCGNVLDTFALQYKRTTMKFEAAFWEVSVEKAIQ